MALSADQQAVLALLLERGQAYDDLAGLLGVDRAEVRRRARAALTELAGADPDRNVGLTDYLLGQADPIGRADASRHLREDRADHELAAGLLAELRTLFPEAELPRLPGEPRAPRRPRRAAATGSRAGRGGLTGSQTRLIAVLGSAAVILLAVVLAVTGAFGGGGDSAADGGEPTTTTATPDEEIQSVPLRAVGGGDASGEALFGLATGDQPFVDISIGGLEPAPGDQQYVIWLMLTRDEGYPLSPISIGRQGTFSNRFAIPSAVIPVVARVRFVDVSIAPADEIRRLVRGALEENSIVLEKPGRTVLRGRVPTTQAAAGG